MVRGRHYFPLEFSAAHRLPLAKDDPPLDFAAIFGATRPVEVEIGHGKGAYLVVAAEQRRDVSFLAIEWSKGRHLYTAERIAKRGFDHVRLVHGDAGDIFARQIPPRSIRRVHLYYPDPYWKKRHAKRRLVTPAFVAVLADALVEGGIVLLKSDVPPRFQDMVSYFVGSERFDALPFEEATRDEPPVVTNFERKAIEAGRPIGAAAFRVRI
jgi:tRNA (guanine-N7-)-methyltransferase